MFVKSRCTFLIEFSPPAAGANIDAKVKDVQKKFMSLIISVQPSLSYTKYEMRFLPKKSSFGDKVHVMGPQWQQRKRDDCGPNTQNNYFFPKKVIFICCC